MDSNVRSVSLFGRNSRRCFMGRQGDASEDPLSQRHIRGCRGQLGI